MANIKNKLYTTCQDYIDNRINDIENQIGLLKESRNSETKSSVGDKYETGRAMIQMELEKSERQRFEAFKVRKLLEQLSPQEDSSFVKAGSLVETNRGSYYIAIGMGKVKVDGQLYYCISSEAPISKLLIGKNKEEEFTFNQHRFIIKNIL